MCDSTVALFMVSVMMANGLLICCWTFREGPLFMRAEKAEMIC